MLKIKNLKNRDYNIYLFKQIKSEYQFNNSFLPSSLNVEFSLCQNIDFMVDKETAKYAVFDHHNEFLVGLNLGNYTPVNNKIIIENQKISQFLYSLQNFKPN